MAPFWRCWFDAIAVSGDDGVIVDEEKCLGCEQCAVSCPEEAIQMTEVRDPAFIPVRIADARRGTMGNKKTIHPKTVFQAPCKGAA